eukprot:scaffold12934_cov129-Isochrysis_galbana.AAC.1
MRAAGTAELRAKKTKMMKRRLQMPTLRSRPSPPQKEERGQCRKKTGRSTRSTAAGKARPDHCIRSGGPYVRS